MVENRATEPLSSKVDSFKYHVGVVDSMEWTNDAKAISAFDDLMTEMYSPLVKWMNTMEQYMSNDPNSVIIRLMAKSVHHYNVGRKEMNLTETESLGHLMSAMTADPELINLMQNMGTMMMNRGAGLE